MDERTIIGLLNKIFKDIIETDDISLSREMSADDIEGWDSLNNTLIISEIQKQFDIKFTLPEVLGFEKIGDLVDSIINKV